MHNAEVRLGGGCGGGGGCVQTRDMGSAAAKQELDSVLEARCSCTGRLRTRFGKRMYLQQDSG